MGLFDSRKELKSMKLVKKLQEEANLEWEREVVRRKQQELNDEAIAKELQAQLQDENIQIPTPPPRIASPPLRVSSPTHTVSNVLPPPLPSKPRAYNSSVSLGISANCNQSTNSLPTSQSFSSLLPEPLYALKSSSSQPALPPRQHNTLTSKKPVKSYLPSQTYKPELQFSLTSPCPVSSTVFYQNTPAIKPAVALPSNTNPSYQKEITSAPDVDVPAHMNMPEPVDMTPPTLSQQDAIGSQHQPFPSSKIPVGAPYPPTYQLRDSLPLDSKGISQHASYPQNSSDTSNYNMKKPVQQNYNQAPPLAHNHNNMQPAIQNFNVTPPAVQNYSDIPSSSVLVNHSLQTTPPVQQPSNAQHSFNTSTSSQQYTSASSTPTHYQNFNTVAPLFRYNAPVQHPSFTVSPLEKYTPHHSVPTGSSTPNCASTCMPLNKQEQILSNNPYMKKKQTFSNYVLTLKPDEDTEEHEDDNEWDALPTFTKRVHTPPPPPLAVSDDNESEYDYSDMIYDRRKEVDPFADSFAVPAADITSESYIQIVDPTALSRQLSKIAVEDVVQKEEPMSQNKGMSKDANRVRVYEEKESIEIVKEEDQVRTYEEKESIEIVKEEDQVRTYEEKESEEIEPRPFQTLFPRPIESTPNYQQSPFYSTPVEEELKVYPTNILRAGAPPQMSATNPYSKKQGAVPASDYGYYKESEKAKDKSLPQVPQTTSPEDRHITVASITHNQRVWIRIHPTDTGKILAERIHIVASYQTRRVTKITTKNGRNIPLDNTPLFDDWNEIINFVEGEAWAIDWVPVESPYVDILTEGKEFMKLLKANFRGTSSAN